MDDSVIKVLRRNGDWKKANKKKVDFEEEKASFDLDDFSLDEKFGILAEEIKNRMKQKSYEKSVDETKQIGNDKNIKNRKNNIRKLDEVKRKLLPFLIELEELAKEKDLHLLEIRKINGNLERIKNKIFSIKFDYEMELENMKKNLDFFSNSLSAINDLMESKK